jgi:hypothetical protein
MLPPSLLPLPSLLSPASALRSSSASSAAAAGDKLPPRRPAASFCRSNPTLTTTLRTHSGRSLPARDETKKVRRPYLQMPHKTTTTPVTSKNKNTKETKS